MKLIRRLAIALVVTVTLQPVAAHADLPTDEGEHSLFVEVPMQLDCDGLNDKAARYAYAHSYCPRPGEDVTTQNTLYGDCGSSFIYIWSRGYGGEADVQYGFRSTKGTVIYRYPNGYWSSVSSLGGDGPVVVALPAAWASAWWGTDVGGYSTGWAGGPHLDPGLGGGLLLALGAIALVGLATGWLSRGLT